MLCFQQSNKSGTSSLISGQHPHDIIPLYSFDLFPTPSWRKSNNSLKSDTTSSRSGSGSKAKAAPRRNRRNCTGPDVVSKEDSDPFDMLECSEIWNRTMIDVEVIISVHTPHSYLMQPPKYQYDKWTLPLETVRNTWSWLFHSFHYYFVTSETIFVVPRNSFY